MKKCFSKPKMASSNVLPCPQPKHIQATVIEEQRNQKIFTPQKLNQRIWSFFSLKNGSNQLKGYQNIASPAVPPFHSKQSRFLADILFG